MPFMICSTRNYEVGESPSDPVTWLPVPCFLPLFRGGSFFPSDPDEDIDSSVDSIVLIGDGLFFPFVPPLVREGVGGDIDSLGGDLDTSSESFDLASERGCIPESESVVVGHPSSEVVDDHVRSTAIIVPPEAIIGCPPVRGVLLKVLEEMVDTGGLACSWGTIDEEDLALLLSWRTLSEESTIAFNTSAVHDGEPKMVFITFKLAGSRANARFKLTPFAISALASPLPKLVGTSNVGRVSC